MALDQMGGRSCKMMSFTASAGSPYQYPCPPKLVSYSCSSPNDFPSSIMISVVIAPNPCLLTPLPFSSQIPCTTINLPTASNRPLTLPKVRIIEQSAFLNQIKNIADSNSWVTPRQSIYNLYFVL
jgi:hypothetical protein